MAENTSSPKKQISPDWFVQGVLTKIGDTFDRLTGRGWKPSSSLATSELIEKLKQLVDSEARESEDKRKFVPHNIKLKMQWDKFSTDSEGMLKKLETELLTALVDHINDKRYYTYAPISLEVKPDYFTSGVKLFAGFEKADEDDRETEISMSMPGMIRTEATAVEDASEAQPVSVTAKWEIAGQPAEKRLLFESGQRLTLGRTKENDLAVDDSSVSKMHASLMMTPEKQFVVADTGSTNGTFVDGERISYGKAVTFSESQKLKLGTVEIALKVMHEPVTSKPELPKTEAFRVGEFEFTSKLDKPTEVIRPALADTEPGIPLPKAEEKSAEAVSVPSADSADHTVSPSEETAASK
jgi:pSer/pThr/pTyr-binding forkhead associated (FHA) protein